MLKYAGSACGMAGSMLVAIATGWQDFGYILMLFGAIIWLHASIKSKDNAAIIQWGYFSIINVIGIISYIGKGL